MAIPRRLSKTALAATMAALYGMTYVPALEAGPTNIHNEPLSTGQPAVPPNIMFILDDSGSMAQDYTPDYIENDALCRDRGGDGSLDACGIGDPVWSSPVTNTQYYNPAITYVPGYDPSLAAPAYDPAKPWLARSNMTNYDTAAKWAAVENDPYSSNSPSGTTNVVVGNRDVVYCTSSSADRWNPLPSGTNGSGCKLPIDTGVVIAAEAAGTGVWRYPNPKYGTSGSGTAYTSRVTRSGSTTNPIPPYFYTISQVLYCVNQNGATPSTEPGCSSVRNGSCRSQDGSFSSKGFFGKGAVGDATNACNTRRFNDRTNNFQWPRFGKIPYDSNADTRALNQQQSGSPSDTTDNTPNRWAGMSGFRRWDIVETSLGSNTLPTGYPSKSDPAVYGTRPDCSFTSCTYTQEMTNYANWYAYYRTRITMMKTAAGLAFYTVDDKFRVGFITINPGSPVSSNKYLALRPFDSTQKLDWYSKFYAQLPGPSTPLRQALSRVGRHFAGKTDGINNGMTFAPDSLNPQGNPDSMTASCQQNFALLTTDGYWNSSGGVKIDGTTTMDNEDHDQPRPQYDGSTGSTNTLADVAMYYYRTDLRPSVMVSGQDIWENNVRSTTKDPQTQQHMTTFTLGLGLDGILNYQPNYDATTPPDGDFKDIVNGAKDWPIPSSSGGDERALDDLWHAAVNGHGKFFSARNPTALSSGLEEALAGMGGTTGAGAAAATSNLQPVAGDNWAFTAEYKTVDWTGDVKARTIDLSTGAISDTSLWSAQALLDAKSASSRTIYTLTTDTTNFPSKLKPFTWTNAGGTTYPTDTNLTGTEQTWLNPAQLVTSNSWNADQVTAATAKTLVDYLRGDRSNEDQGNNAVTDLYRPRAHVLGDIVSAQPIYIKEPPFAYADAGYADFQAAQASRRGTLFVASNDGMLHAFETDPDGRPYYQTGGIGTPKDLTDDTYSSGTNDGGGERWAFIPPRVMAKLYKLAQKSYEHKWYVDGTPIVEDMCQTTGSAGSGDVLTPSFTCPDAASWKTIIVGGLNGGGRGYYALDITDPTNPKGLWEFNARDPAVTACAATTAAAVGATTDCDLGLTYGNPIVTKLPLGHAQSGKWVVIVSSGYNNYPTVDATATRTTGGDGNGYLYILDAFTGQIIEKIQTCTGSAGTAPDYTDAAPCGFAKINTYHPFANDRTDNSPVRVYGTTLTGELWRVDLTQQVSPRAYLVATMKDGSANAQPITTPPEMFLPDGLDDIAFSNPWEAPAAVYIGTGRYLGVPDKTDFQHQSIYAIKDQPGVTSTVANARTVLQLRTFGNEFVDANSGTTRRDLTGAPGANPFTSASGWYVDFPDVNSVATGERVNVDFRIVSTTLVIASNIPKVNSCVAGGTGWLNFIDVNTGKSILGLTTPYASQKLGSSLAVGISPIQLGDKIKTIVTTADNQQLTFDTPIAGGQFQGQRVQWRELQQ